MTRGAAALCRSIAPPRCQGGRAAGARRRACPAVLACAKPSGSGDEAKGKHGRREGVALALAGVALAGLRAEPSTASPSTAPAADALGRTRSFLRDTGAKGFLADEEEKLVKLRVEKEDFARRLDAEARKEVEEAITRARIEGEMEAKRSFEQGGGNRLCATPYGIDVVGITEGIALVGALVGGISSKLRKDEVQRLNDQLRTINVSLRKQARSGTVYAPGLVYAPPSPSAIPLAPREGQAGDGGPGDGAPTDPAPAPPAEDAAEDASATSAAQAPALSPTPTPAPTQAQTPTAMPTPRALTSMDDASASDEAAVALKSGRKLLEQKKGAAALVHFEKAKMLSRKKGSRLQERRAERGLAAASRLQQQYNKTIGHLMRVLEISKEMNEFTGDADAYGNIADVYTELGDLENAGKYYDLYIERMTQDDN